MNPKYEKLTKCSYCWSKKIKLILKSNDLLNNIPGTFFLSKCQKCKLVFQNPRIKQKYISKYYHEETGYFKPSKIAPKTNKLITYILKHYFWYFNGKVKTNCINPLITFLIKEFKIALFPNFIQNWSLLEIWCSHWAFLERMNILWRKTTWVEIHKKAAEYAKKKRHLNIYNQGISQFLKTNNKCYDVVILSMVLEHLYNPFKVLKELSAKIKTNWHLIFSIPYFESIPFRIFWKYSYGLQLPTHITFINKKILKNYLNSLWYNNIFFYFQHEDRDIVASAWYKYEKEWWLLNKILAKNKIVRYLCIKPFIFILSLIGKTSRVTIYAQKF